MGVPIDIDALRQSASRTDSEHALVSRRWLAQVELELREGRAARAQLAGDRAIAGFCEAMAPRPAK